jgi:hypothetical protein
MSIPFVDIGDSVLVRRHSWWSLLTAWGCRGRREKKTKVTHMDTSHATGFILHTCSPAVHEDRWDFYREFHLDDTEFCIVRPIGLTLEQKNTILDEGMKMRGWKYKSFLLFLQAVDGLIGKVSGKKSGLDVIFARRLTPWWDDGVICSMTTARLYIMARILSEEYIYACPDDISDYVEEHPDKFEIIYKTANWDR